MTEVDGAARERPCADAVRLIPEATGDTEWRIREIRAVLDEADQSGACEGDGAYLASQLDRIREILDSAPPAPRVFFPGDRVPVGTVLMSKDGSPFRVPDVHTSEGMARVGVPFVEVLVPSPEEWQAIVDRATSEPAIPEPTEGQNRG